MEETGADGWRPTEKLSRGCALPKTLKMHPILCAQRSAAAGVGRPRLVGLANASIPYQALPRSGSYRADFEAAAAPEDVFVIGSARKRSTIGGSSVEVMKL
jgi:hypothetical protein